MNDDPKMSCESAQALVPGYLDGELSEAQAGPLRHHLMDCPNCRAFVQQGKALSAWFPRLPEVSVPASFAERVTRLAFAGGRTGRPESELGEKVAVDVGRETRRPPIMGATAPVGPALLVNDGEEVRRRTHDFILQLTAMAAILLVVLSIALRQQRLPADGELQAQDGSLSEALMELDELNAAEASGVESASPAMDALGPVNEEMDAEN